MRKTPLTNRKEWIFFLGTVMFILGFWAQPFFIASNKSDIVVGITVIVSILGLAIMVLLVEPRKAKFKKYYPLFFAGVILLEMFLQVVAKIIFQ